MQKQQAISARRLQRRVGTTVEVLVDEAVPGGAKGRSFAEAPEIDGTVHLRATRPLRPGMLVQARIERADAYDLWARPLVGG